MKPNTDERNRKRAVSVLFWLSQGCNHLEANMRMFLEHGNKRERERATEWNSGKKKRWFGAIETQGGAEHSDH